MCVRLLLVVRLDVVLTIVSISGRVTRRCSSIRIIPSYQHRHVGCWSPIQPPNHRAPNTAILDVSPPSNHQTIGLPTPGPVCVGPPSTTRTIGIPNHPFRLDTWPVIAGSTLYRRRQDGYWAVHRRGGGKVVITTLEPRDIDGKCTISVRY